MFLSVKNLERISERIENGESIRVWYSDNPDECCGLYWFMAQLFDKKLKCDSIVTVKLPDMEYDGEKTIIRRHSWGEVSAEEWNRYLPLQKEQPETFVKMCAVRWKELQEENMPLRAVLNGRLVSVDDNIYDHFIIREILSEPEEFSEAKVIGRILGKYQFGISDSWVHFRMEKMIARGELAVVAEARKDEPVYRRTLEKIR